MARLYVEDSAVRRKDDLERSEGLQISQRPRVLELPPALIRKVRVDAIVNVVKERHDSEAIWREARIPSTDHRIDAVRKWLRVPLLRRQLCGRSESRIGWHGHGRRRVRRR